MGDKEQSGLLRVIIILGLALIALLAAISTAGTTKTFMKNTNNQTVMATQKHIDDAHKEQSDAQNKTS